MSVSDNRISAVHSVGRQMLATRAHLAAWVVARERGISVEDCDAIADAAVTGALELLAHWEATPNGNETLPLPISLPGLGG